MYLRIIKLHKVMLMYYTIILLVKIRVHATICDESQQKKETKPNIIIILADDLGFNDVSIHGKNQIPTPNIDALGIMGIQLNQMYSAPMCTPSRSALLTGKYESNLGMQHFVIPSDQPYGLGLHEKTMADYMKCAGYRTYLIGKWHLGFYKQRYTPLYRGFDSHFGYLGPYIDYFDHRLYMDNRNYSGGYDMRKNFRVNWNTAGKYATDLFTEKSIETINNHNKSIPMFMMISHLAPHAGNADDPLQAPDDEIRKFNYIENVERRIYAAMVSKLDKSVGKVIEALERNKMLENSVILFMSDNGAPVKGEHSNSGSNFPFRGQKDSPWEGAVRSAAAIWSTRLKRRQRISNQKVHISDWLPTFAKLAGVNIDDQIDGKNVWNALSCDSPSPRREILVHHDAATPYMAYISDNFKLISGSTYDGIYDGWLYDSIDVSQQNATFGRNYGRTILTSNAGKTLSKYSKTKNDPIQSHGQMTISVNEINKIRSDAIVTCNGYKFPANNSAEMCNPIKASCLFDIESDPCETTNLATKYPDVVRKLQNKLNYYGRIALPIRNKPSDPRCNPANFGGIWTWWFDELNISEM